ncbi:hypothetical protein SPRG_15421 [Saprolegnia parasitica CBS 223.65]|uniref:START domain-containing protein n=1 Tax=Saprolegnia parasitica (strain CBS 223.65) TaxID=695850 RepID=A0A067BYN3_SAPPC|nr:hypothetical protein SPRG_15421 [Saprolegnia parasitica CBS 223.65]KDO19431.1 hypothetical protein SPRG_15421 [Saprolegnia parasitica CBS 223.65]|eukprot:XP_012209857.1 hypothetical protein SPRG_15421 [Saprolegnia parasitica CBS 223.65]
MSSLRSLLNPTEADNGSTSSDAAKEPSDRKRRHDRAKARYMEEVSYLQEKSKELQDQLDGLERSKKRKTETTASVWEGFARRQALERQEAQLENAKLKGVLTQQLSIIKGLEAVLSQRPQLLTWPTLPMNDASIVRFPKDPALRAAEFERVMTYELTWPTLPMNDASIVRFPKDPAQRAAEFERVMTYELARLDETYRKFGLVNTLDTWKQVVVRMDEATHEVVLDVSFSLVVHVPARVLADAMTIIYIPNEDLSVRNGSVKFLERFDPHSVYVQRIFNITNLPQVVAHFACRCARVAADHAKFALVSVMDDDAVPYPHHALRSREHIYASAEPLNGTQSRWKMVRRVHIPASLTAQVPVPIGALVELLLHCYSDNIEILMRRMRDVLPGVAGLAPHSDLVEPAGELIQLNQTRLSPTH